MLSTTSSHRIPRRAAIAAALTLTAACAAPAGALAAEAPTLGPPTIIPAGQQSPIDVAGNKLHQHDVIAKGTQLVRRLVSMNGVRNGPVTLTCPDGMIVSGVGMQEGSGIGFGFNGADEQFKSTLPVLLEAAPKVDPNAAVASIYALCRDTSIAPMIPFVGFPVTRKAGQTSPVDVAGNHLHQGAKIRSATQLLRFPVIMRGRSDAYQTLFCPKGTVHRGLAQQEGSKINAIVSKNSRYGHNTIKVRFSARSGAATGSVYALCGRA